MNIHGRLGAVVDFKLSKNIRNMRLNSLDGDQKLRCNLMIGFSLRNEERYYWKGEGLISIKTFSNGRAYYNTLSGSFYG
jgi:hypothetical protein